MDKTAGRGLGISTRWSMLQDLKQMGVRVLTSTVARVIEPDGVLVTHDDGRQEKIPADSVIIAVGSLAESLLYEELRDEFPEVYLIGDARQVRTALDAVREGFDAGYSI